MQDTLNTIAEAVSKYGITMECSPPRPHTDKEWPAVAYTVALSRKGNPFWTNDYKMGIGCVKIPKPGPFGAGMKYRLTADEERMLYGMNTRPHANFQDKLLQSSLCAKLAAYQKVAPKLADVLHCILSDADCECGFEEWCANFGYDSDSIKALRTFEECDKTRQQLRRAFSPSEIEDLRATFQDY